MAAKKKCISRSNKMKNLATKTVFEAIWRYEQVDTIRSLLREGVDMRARVSKGRTLLLYASSRGQKLIVNLIIKRGANVNGKCIPDHYTVLHHASRYGWIKIVRTLVNKVFDLDAMDIRGETALHHAATSGRLNVVKCLLQNGAVIDRKNLMGFTPLINAAQFSRKLIFDLLLDSGANVDGNERVLLYFAFRNRWTKTVQFLLKKVCDSSERAVIDDIDLDATSSRGHLQLVKFLIEEGTDINDRGNEIILQESLYYASYMGHMEVVKWLVKQGDDMNRLPDINLKHKFGCTALYLASSSGHLEVVKCLVRKGADINTRNHKRWSSLHIASEKGYLEVVKLLVEKGADINTADNRGLSPLHIASKNEKLEVVKALVGKEANMIRILNAETKYGNTALYFASRAGNLEMVKWLVEKEADLNVKNYSGETPLFKAAAGNYKHVVDFLMRSGANLDGTNERKWTLLHLASASGWIDTVQALIKGGCDLEAGDEHGMTALRDAFINNQLGTAQALLQAGARWDTAGIYGFLPLEYLTEENKPEFVKLFIENGGYLKPVDYNKIVNSSALRVLQDQKLCCQAIVNKFNNHDLPEFYKLPVSEKLPRIEKVKIATGGDVAQAIERAVEFEIQTNGHCNILEFRPNVLSVLSVGSVLEYYTKKTLELRNRLK